MADNEIVITGYMRSGNTWLARLIADALNSPLVGLPDREIIPIGQEGLNRPGPYLIRQLHLLPVEDSKYTEAIPDSHHFAIDHWDGQHLIVMVRDPRDVAVSCMYYWEIPSLKETIEKMAIVEWPLAAAGRWDDFYSAWLECPLATHLVKYEGLKNNTLRTLEVALGGIEPVNDLQEVIDRQALEVRRQEFEQTTGHYHPYGTGVQLKNLRKGVVGDWKNHFTTEDGELFHGYFYNMMQRLGYEKDVNWYLS